MVTTQQFNMAAVDKTTRARYPSEKQVKKALDTLKPSGILSNAYDQFQLKRYEREENIKSNHLVNKGDPNLSGKWNVQSSKPVDLTQDTSYFNAKTVHSPPSQYDRINGVVEGYNQKLHRDDREHAKSRGLRVNNEETQVNVPVLSSSIYGHPKRVPLEIADRKHVRMELCKKDFLRLGGTNIDQNNDLH